MVECIERLEPELERSAFGFEPRQRELLVQGQIPIIATRTREHIAAHVPKHAGFSVSQKLRFDRLRDDGGIKPTHHRPELRIDGCSLVNLHRSYGIAAYPGTDSGGKTSYPAIEVHRHSRKEVGNAADLPAA